MTWAEGWAYGPLELKPWEFERLQPYEFEQLIEGWNWRNELSENNRKRTETVLCYLTAHLLNVSGKSIKGKITVADLTRPLEDKPKRDKQSDKEYLKELFPDAFGGD